MLLKHFAPFALMFWYRDSFWADVSNGMKGHITMQISSRMLIAGGVIGTMGGVVTAFHFDNPKPNVRHVAAGAVVGGILGAISGAGLKNLAISTAAGALAGALALSITTAIRD